VRALWFEDVGQLIWREVEDLVVTHPLEAIVRPVASTTCDLDRAIVHGLVPLGNGFPIGHECVAEVLEVGSAVHRVAVGDLVVVPWHISCGVCPPCRKALPTACTTVPGLQGYGASIAGDWGGLFSEQARVPYADAMLTRLPPGVEPAAAASVSDNLTDAFVCVTRGLSRHPGARVLVVSSLPSLGLFAVDQAMAAGPGRSTTSIGAVGAGMWPKPWAPMWGLKWTPVPNICNTRSSSAPPATVGFCVRLCCVWRPAGTCPTRGCSLLIPRCRCGRCTSET